MDAIAYRVAAWDTPLWINANRNAGRFNHEGVGPVQYWGLHPLTPWAEYCRGQGMTEADALEGLRQRLWVGRFVAVDAKPVNFENAANFGLDPGDLVSDDHSRCRDFGELCLRDPSYPSALVVPSAALPGTQNLVIFGARVQAPFSVDPVDAIDIPVTVAADEAKPLATLLERVRHQGQSHAEYESWQLGDLFEFDEPATPLNLA